LVVTFYPRVNVDVVDTGQKDDVHVT